MNEPMTTAHPTFQRILAYLNELPDERFRRLLHRLAER